MTRRTLAINWGDNLFVSQEFNGDRKEAQMFGLKSAKPFWEDVVEKFKGVRTVRAFERTLEEVEQIVLQDYKVYMEKQLQAIGYPYVPDTEP